MTIGERMRERESAGRESLQKGKAQYSGPPCTN